MTSTPAATPQRKHSGAVSPGRHKPHPSAVARLRATLKMVLAHAGPFERSIRVSIITDPALGQRFPTLLNTGSEISLNPRFLRQVADGSRRLHDVLVIEFARAAAIALGKRARTSNRDEAVSGLEIS